MAVAGYTEFVIEGNKGKEIYDLFMNLKEKCSNEEEIKLATSEKYSYYIFITSNH